MSAAFCTMLKSLSIITSLLLKTDSITCEKRCFLKLTALHVRRGAFILLWKQRQKSDKFFPRCLGEAHDSFLRNEAGQVRHLITIATSTDEAAVSAALLGLGGPSPAHCSPEEVLRVVARWALVGIGPESAKHWRQENAKEAL